MTRLLVPALASLLAACPQSAPPPALQSAKPVPTGAAVGSWRLVIPEGAIGDPFALSVGEVVASRQGDSLRVHRLNGMGADPSPMGPIAWAQVEGDRIVYVRPTLEVGEFDLVSTPQWSTELARPQHETFRDAVVGRTHLYVIAQAGNHDGLVVKAVSRTGHEQVWETRLHGNNVRATADAVALLGDDENLRVLDAATGKVRWTDRVAGALAFATSDRHVIAATKDGVFAWDAARGTRRKLGAGSLGIRLDTRDDVLYVLSEPDARIAAIDLATDRTRWSIDAPAAAFTVTATSVFALTDGDVLIAFDRETGKRRWAHDVTEPLLSGTTRLAGHGSRVAVITDPDHGPTTVRFFETR